MPRPNIIIIDCDTKEEILREMNDEEFWAYEANLAAQAAKDEAARAEA
jgi:hypothetical protein